MNIKDWIHAVVILFGTTAAKLKDFRANVFLYICVHTHFTPAVQLCGMKQDSATCPSNRACTSLSCVWSAKVWNNLARRTNTDRDHQSHTRGVEVEVRGASAGATQWMTRAAGQMHSETTLRPHEQTWVRWQCPRPAWDITPVQIQPTAYTLCNSVTPNLSAQWMCPSLGVTKHNTASAFFGCTLNTQRQTETHNTNTN